MSSTGSTRRPDWQAASRPPVQQTTSSKPVQQPVQQPVQRETAEPAQQPVVPMPKLRTPQIPQNSLVRQLVTPKNGGKIARHLQPALDLLVAQAAVGAAQPNPKPADSAKGADAPSAEAGQKTSIDRPVELDDFGVSFIEREEKPVIA